MTSRTSMLEEIRSNLAESAPFERLYHQLQPSPRALGLPSGRVSKEELANRFSRELTAVGGEVHRTGSKDAQRAIGAIFRDVGAKHVAISDLALINHENLPGVELIVDASREDLFAADAGITTAQLAIAETGTLVMRSTMERHRLVSLVPPIHVCLLEAANIRLTMADALEEMSSAIDPAITFITGPSRTSDIELTLAIGVHGPKRLIVVLIN